MLLLIPFPYITIVIQNHLKGQCHEIDAGVVDTGGNLPPVSLIPVVHLDLRYLREFSKKFETILLRGSGAGGKLTHGKKTRSKKSRDTVPLTKSVVFSVSKIYIV